MSSSKAVLDLYIQLRTENLPANAALEFLRGDIQALDSDERAALVKRVKRWEDSHRPDETVGFESFAETPTSPKPILKPLAAPKVSPPTPAYPPPKPKTGSIGNKQKDMASCPQCGRMNAAAEVLCFNCGAIMNQATLGVETVHFGQSGSMGDTTFFSAESTLVLVVRSTNFTFRVMPQKFSHAPVVGRSDNASFVPDLDLSDQNAAELGVSRMHIELQYDRKENTLTLVDMKSSNGTFINGLRVYPQERRVLRHGDELRLGRLVMHVYFQHP
jgi:hypothetical protein